MGRSRPSLWRRSSTSLPYAFSSSMSCTASPGSSRGRVKTMSEAMISEGIATTSRLRRYRLSTGSAVEPGREQTAAPVVAEIGHVVLEGAVPHPDVDAGGRVDVVLLVSGVALDLVEHLSPLGHVRGAPLADHQVAQHGIVDVALVLELVGHIGAEEVVVGVEERRLRPEGHGLVLAVEGRADVRAVLLLDRLGVDADVLQVFQEELDGVHLDGRAVGGIGQRG